MDMFTAILGLGIGLAVLVKAADYFTQAAEQIGYAFRIPSFIVGVTIVAIGTSLPELMTSLLAVQLQQTDIVIGNVVGSNIANIFLVLGIAAVLKNPMKILRKLETVDLPMFVGSAFFLTLAAMDGVFTQIEAMLAIAFALVYLSFLTTEGSKLSNAAIAKHVKHVVDGKDARPKPKFPVYLQLFGSLAFLYAGAFLTVESVTQLSMLLSIGTEILALTAVAVGTSLPELAVSVQAARRGKAEIAFGNVFGSNIFNALLVMGIPGLLTPILIPADIIEFSLPVMLTATLVFSYMLWDKQITKWEGMGLLIFYAFFFLHTVGLM